jgi:DNA-directed RNA polymerase specialized sigma24 family protein
MISDGYENCVMYMHNFDPEKYNNPFAYFTQIIHHAFIRRIQKERKQQYIKLKITQDQFITDDIDGSENQAQLYTNNHEYIRDYEYSLSYKKKKAKKIGLEQFLD